MIIYDFTFIGFIIKIFDFISGVCGCADELFTDVAIDINHLQEAFELYSTQTRLNTNFPCCALSSMRD